MPLATDDVRRHTVHTIPALMRRNVVPQDIMHAFRMHETPGSVCATWHDVYMDIGIKGAEDPAGTRGVGIADQVVFPNVEVPKTSWYDGR